MKSIKNISVLIFFTILLTSCSNTLINKISGCPDAAIEWVDLVMIQDIRYQHHFPEPASENVPLSLEKGREIGKVTYQMADHACSDHKMRNGDAAYLEKGTLVYELKGYPTTFIVEANEKIYVVDQNKKAKTAGEMYPLQGLVKNIYIESTEDGSRIHTFSASSTDKFLKAWDQLKLEDYDTLYKKHSFEGERVFLEIELNNGASFRNLYWADSNTLNNGVVGNQEIKDIIMSELANSNVQN